MISWFVKLENGRVGLFSAHSLATMFDVIDEFCDPYGVEIAPIGRKNRSGVILPIIDEDGEHINGAELSDYAFDATTDDYKWKPNPFNELAHKHGLGWYREELGLPAYKDLI